MERLVQQITLYLIDTFKKNENTRFTEIRDTVYKENFLKTSKKIQDFTL